MAKILVVEDNLLNFKLVGDVLTDFGHVVKHAENCRAFLTQIETFQPDLILMDIGLPDINGIDCFKLVRQQSDFNHVPILAFTASVMPEQIEQIRTIGFDAIIEKPIGIKSFVQTISEHLNKTSN